MVGGKVLAVIGCRVGGRQAEAGLPWLLLLCGWLPAARLSSLLMTLSLGRGGDGWDYLSLSLSLQLILQPPSCACCPLSSLVFFFFSSTNTMFHSLPTSVPASLTVLPVYLWVFPQSLSLPRPTTHQPTHPPPPSGLEWRFLNSATF